MGFSIMKGIKHDQGKVDLSFLEFEMLESICRVFEYGQGLYGKDNWKDLPDGENRFKKAALRHLIQSNTERLDPESNLPHVNHVLASIIMSEWHKRNKK